MYANGPQGSIVKIYHSKFVQNVGVLVFTLGDSMLITHCKFINNRAPYVMVCATDSNNTFIDSIGQVLLVWDTSMRISHSVFVNNNAGISVVEAYGRVITSVDHNKFTNNTGTVLNIGNANMIYYYIVHNKFVDNTVATGSLIDLYGDMISVNLSEFINNRVDHG